MSKQTKPLYEFGPFRLDLTERRLLRDGEPVALTPMALETLVVLVERRGRLVEKEEMLKTLWPDSFVEEHNLANNISTLRKALGEAKNTAQYIETVPKRGYRFVSEVREVSDEVTEVILERHTRSSVIIEEETTAQAGEDATSWTVLSPPQPAVVPDEAPSTTYRYTRWRAKPLIWTAVLLVAISSALWLSASRHRNEPSLPPMKVVPFTSFLGEEYMPSFSPDGNQIAFGWNGERGVSPAASSIYVKQIGSENRVRLTFDSSYLDMGPVYSPDGQRIAFNRHTETECSIFIVPALGGVARKLITLGPNPGWPMFPTLSWSPDGRFIAYPYKDSKDEPYKIFMVSPDTFTKQTLTSPSAEDVGDFNPAFSPDGQSVAFFRMSYNSSSRISSDSSADIYIVPTNGGEPRRLTFDNAKINGLDWTADGREIVFSSNRAGGISSADSGYSLWRIPASGGTAERVALGGDNFWFPRIARHGNRLTYVQGSPEDANIYQIEVSDTTVSQKPPTRLIASTRYDGGPQFSPDGRKITFHSDRSGQFEVWMCDSDGANLVQVTSSGLNKRSGSPRWSPDGQQIVFDVTAEGKGDIYAISVEGGLPRPIVTGDADDHWPSWSADGKWIYFTSDRTGICQVWKVPAQGGEAVQVTRQGGIFPCESFDSKYVYYIKPFPTQGIWQVPVDGGEELQIMNSFQSALLGDWAVAGDGIYFINEHAKDGVVIEFFDFAVRKVRQVASLGKVHILEHGITVPPDGRQILYTQNDQHSADITLVENFH